MGSDNSCNSVRPSTPNITDMAIGAVAGNNPGAALLNTAQPGAGTAAVAATTIYNNRDAIGRAVINTPTCITKTFNTPVTGANIPDAAKNKMNELGACIQGK